MEIPPDLKMLYPHWAKHAAYQPLGATNDVQLDEYLLKDVVDFASKRMNAWENKISGRPKPYSPDPILQAYRFCNIYRELDGQTIQIHQDLLALKDNFSLWLLNLVFHRFTCRPQTVQKIGHLTFETAENERVMQRLRMLPRPKYGTAYIFPISAIQRGEYPTREEFFCLYLPQVIPTVADLILSFDNQTITSALGKILPVFGYNFRFHWTEVLIDVAYQFPEKINLFKDFHVGPGAYPTMMRLGNKNKDVSIVLNKLTSLRLPDFPYLTYNGSSIPLSAENWEGIGCEFRKYTNLLNGSGRKRLYINPS